MVDGIRAIGNGGQPTGNAATVAESLLAVATVRGSIDIERLRNGLAELAQQDLPQARLVARELGLHLTPVQQGQLQAALAPVASVAADFAIPASPDKAPATLTFASHVQMTFDDQWAASFPGGVSKEQGGTLVYDQKTGVIDIQNIGGSGSTSGTFSPDTTIKDPKTHALLGVFHTHPYDKSEGGHTGVSLSGGDAGYLITTKQNVIIAQSGDKQFMYLRTDKTPATVDATALNNSQNKRIGELMGKGMDFAAASRQAAAETAKTYGLAYYEGANGSFKRADP